MQTVLDILSSLHFHPVVFVVQLVLFTLFHFAMRAIVYDPLIATRNERDGRIQGHLRRAELAAEEAQSMKAAYEEQIKTQRLSLAQELKEAIEAAEKQAASVLQAARDEASRVTDEANAALDQEEQQLKAGMDDAASKLAVAVAEKVVRNSLADADQSRVLARLKG